MDMIAAEANVSKATVYAHFKNKDGLFARMVDTFCIAQDQAIARIEADHPDTHTALRWLARGLLEAWAEPNTLRFGRMMMGEGSRFPRLGKLFVESGVLQVQRRISDFFAKLAQRGELTMPDPDLGAEFFVSLTRGAVQMRSLAALGAPPAADELDKLADGMAAMFVAAYRPAD